MESTQISNEIDQLIRSMEKIPREHNAPGLAAVHALINWPSTLNIMEMPVLFQFVRLFKATHSEDNKKPISKIKDLAPLVNGCLKFKSIKAGVEYNKVSNIELYAALTYIKMLDKEVAEPVKENINLLLAHVINVSSRRIIYGSAYDKVNEFYRNAKQAWVILHSAYKNFCTSSLFKKGLSSRAERFKIWQSVVECFRDCLEKYSSDFYAEVFFQPEKYFAHGKHVANLEIAINKMRDEQCVVASNNASVRISLLTETLRSLEVFLNLHKKAFVAQFAFQKAKVEYLNKSEHAPEIVAAAGSRLSGLISLMEDVAPVNRAAFQFAAADGASAGSTPTHGGGGAVANI
jgi:hypothetical protein